jgi:hypothetical protein
MYPGTQPRTFFGNEGTPVCGFSEGARGQSGYKFQTEHKFPEKSAYLAK